MATVKMSDIAARAGVSQATVSYVINERGAAMRISEDTRRRILEVAAEMGYRRNEVARTMVTGRSYNFAFMTQGPSDELAVRLMVGAQEVADEHGYVIRLLPVTPRMDFRKRIEYCMEQRIAGILVTNITPEALAYLTHEAERFNVPVVLVDDPPLAQGGIRVTADNAQGVRQAVEHLAGLGHKRIGYISAQLDTTPGVSRKESFVHVMGQLGLPCPDSAIVPTNWHKEEIIAEGVERFMRHPEGRPTALLCGGDKIAMVTVRTLRRMGLRVPEDVSVVGFANFQMAAYADPPLTTVAQPFEEMGRLATTLLLQRINDPGPLQPKLHSLPTELVIRESTAPPAG